MSIIYDVRSTPHSLGITLGKLHCAKLTFTSKHVYFLLWWPNYLFGEKNVVTLVSLVAYQHRLFWFQPMSIFETPNAWEVRLNSKMYSILQVWRPYLELTYNRLLYCTWRTYYHIYMVGIRTLVINCKQINLNIIT